MTTLRPARALFAPRAPWQIVVVLALWLTLVANLALWRALFAIDARPGGVALTIGVAVVLAAATTALLALTAWGRWMKPVWLAVVLAAAFSQHYMLAYGVVIDRAMIQNIGQSNAGEIRDLLTWTMVGNVLLVAALPAIWLWRVPVRRTSTLRKAGAAAALFAGSLALGVALTAALYSQLAPLVRNNMGLRYLPNPLRPLVSLADVLRRNAKPPPKAMAATSAGAALGPSHALAGAKPPLLVLVVGETARADHFGLNGYARDTTPELAARGVLSWSDVWSCGTYTLVSLPCMFSPLGKEGFDKRDREHENLLDVARAAGIAVLWVDNQAGCKGVCDRVASASTADLAAATASAADKAEAARLCRDGECLDEALLVGIDRRIAALPEAQRKNGVLLVLHEMGSHGPAYFRRSDATTKRFLPECTNTVLSECDRQQLINAYDNTIVHNDRFLARTIDWARAQSAAYAPAMLYLSDHGESLGEYGVFLHGLPYAIAPDTQKRVPMVAWFGSDAVGRSKLDLACLRAGLGARLSHDNLFHTVLGLLDVASPGYRPALDVAAGCRLADAR